MKISKITWIAFTATALGSVLFFSLTGQSTVDPSSKIGSSLRAQITRQEPNLPALVILKAQADLTGASALTERHEKTQFVYDALRRTALASQQALIAFLDQKQVSYHRYYILNTVAVDGATPELIQELAARSDVAKIIANPSVKNLLPSPQFVESKGPHTLGAESSLVKMGAEKVWTELKVRGEGIVVAGQDTGVQWDHPALKNQYRGYNNGAVDHTYSWHDAIHKAILPETNPCGYDLSTPCDDDQHGSHTMGTMIGDDGQGNQIGVAPKAQWIACRNMDTGVGTPATYIECFEFFLAPYPQGGNSMTDGRPAYAPHVINNSWGCPTDEGCEGGEFAPVLDALQKAGIFVVVSAGNDGSKCGTISSPPASNSPSTLSVGALDHTTGKIAYFSSRGPSKLDGEIGPDVSAPGVNIRSSVPGDKFAQDGWSGTSMAGPHVVGEVALLWSANAKLVGKIAETTDIIRKTSDPKTSTEKCGGVEGTKIPNNTYGWGMINAYTAVKSQL